MMTTSVTIDLPNPLVQQLESIAREQHRSVSDMVRERLLQTWSSLPPLPDDVEMELALFTGLSDDVLWLLARSSLAASEREELANLNALAKQQALTKTEQARQQILLDAYDRVLVRRAQAAFLLKQRGYDMVGIHHKIERAMTFERCWQT
jgi:hypothetical protein